MCSGGNTMRTVIFDLDGTLADTSVDLLVAANVALAEFGHPVRFDPDDPENRSTAMQGTRAMLSRALGTTGITEPAQIDRCQGFLLQAYARAISVHTRLFPGAMAAVGQLAQAGHRVGICTNKPEALAHQLLDELGVRTAFASLIGADTLAVCKPDPRPLYEAVRRAHGDPGQCCLVGDSVTDLKTARAAKVPIILTTFGALSGTAARKLTPEAVLEDFDALAHVVSNLDPV